MFLNKWLVSIEREECNFSLKLCFSAIVFEIIVSYTNDTITGIIVSGRLLILSLYIYYLATIQQGIKGGIESFA